MKSKTYHRDYMRKRRADAAAQGLCTNCAGARPARPGLKTCDVCCSRSSRGVTKGRIRKRVRAFLDNIKPDA